MTNPVWVMSLFAALGAAFNVPSPILRLKTHFEYIATGHGSFLSRFKSDHQQTPPSTEIIFDLTESGFTNNTNYYFWIQYDDKDAFGNPISANQVANDTFVFKYRYQTPGVKKMNITISDTPFQTTGRPFPAYFAVTSDSLPPAIATTSFEVLPQNGLSSITIPYSI